MARPRKGDLTDAECNFAVERLRAAPRAADGTPRRGGLRQVAREISQSRVKAAADANPELARQATTDPSARAALRRHAVSARWLQRQLDARGIDVHRPLTAGAKADARPEATPPEASP